MEDRKDGMESRRDFGKKILSAAAVGLLVGSALKPAKVFGEEKEEKKEKHDCKGKNECKGKGGCKTEKNECAGKNECKAKGGCAVPKKEEKTGK